MREREGAILEGRKQGLQYYYKSLLGHSEFLGEWPAVVMVTG